MNTSNSLRYFRRDMKLRMPKEMLMSKKSKSLLEDLVRNEAEPLVDWIGLSINGWVDSVTRGTNPNEHMVVVEFYAVLNDCKKN
jgi:hypothetical protein